MVRLAIPPPDSAICAHACRLGQRGTTFLTPSLATCNRSRLLAYAISSIITESSSLRGLCTALFGLPLSEKPLRGRCSFPDPVQHLTRCLSPLPASRPGRFLGVLYAYRYLHETDAPVAPFACGALSTAAGGLLVRQPRRPCGPQGRDCPGVLACRLSGCGAECARRTARPSASLVLIPNFITGCVQAVALEECSLVLRHNVRDEYLCGPAFTRHQWRTAVASYNSDQSTEERNRRHPSSSRSKGVLLSLSLLMLAHFIKRAGPVRCGLGSPPPPRLHICSRSRPSSLTPAPPPPAARPPPSRRVLLCERCGAILLPALLSASTHSPRRCLLACAAILLALLSLQEAHHTHVSIATGSGGGARRVGLRETAASFASGLLSAFATTRSGGVASGAAAAGMSAAGARAQRQRSEQPLVVLAAAGVTLPLAAWELLRLNSFRKVARLPARSPPHTHPRTQPHSSFGDRSGSQVFTLFPRSFCPGLRASAACAPERPARACPSDGARSRRRAGPRRQQQGRRDRQRGGARARGARRAALRTRSAPPAPNGAQQPSHTHGRVRSVTLSTATPVLHVSVERPSPVRSSASPSRRELRASSKARPSWPWLRSSYPGNHSMGSLYPPLLHQWPRPLLAPLVGPRGRSIETRAQGAWERSSLH